jgi:hypothetical protein
LEALKAWMEICGGLQLRKPVQVHDADFLENSAPRQTRARTNQISAGKTTPRDVVCPLK